MKQLEHPQALQVITSGNPNIKLVEDKSDFLMKRALVCFRNDYQLSIISGPFAYGSEQGLFEIAIFDREGNFCPELFEEGDSDVLGYQSEQQVIHYINKVGSLPEGDKYKNQCT